MELTTKPHKKISLELSVSNSQYCIDTINLFKRSMGHLAERLWNISSKELWNSSWSSFDEYLREVGIGKGTASKLCSIYQRVVTELGFPAETLYTVSWGNLYAVLPMMADKETAKYAIAVAATLTSEEVKLELYKHKHGGECLHEHGVLYRKCDGCGTFTKIHEQH
jgi:predicted metalloenzyme YecM